MTKPTDRLIDNAMWGINDGYLLGMVARLQADPTRWGKMIRMENAICEASTSGDRGGLVKTLSEYRMFLRSGEQCLW